MDYRGGASLRYSASGTVEAGHRTYFNPGDIAVWFARLNRYVITKYPASPPRRKVLTFALRGLALTFTITPLMADLVSATSQLKSQHPTEFGDSDAMAQVYVLFIFAYSTGALVGPAVAGLLKTHAGWATIALACACGVACVPIIAESRRC